VPPTASVFSLKTWSLPNTFAGGLHKLNHARGVPELLGASTQTRVREPWSIRLTDTGESVLFFQFKAVGHLSRCPSQR
jgi:hypothetical protein